ncbi:MAG: DEAD/DEAH box helicase [Planctomycetes bacterium]|nr:DEAD/DEAH box helicase [Planctomycetota bacterium]
MRPHIPALEPLPVESPASETSEAYQTLLSRAHRKTGSIPAAPLVKHVLDVTREADWPVQREAMEALLRRLSFARKDQLTIADRPPGGRVLGFYATRRKGSTDRPYRTRLDGVDPPRGSCDCPDFLRSSLALCKHLLVILEDIASSPRKLELAMESLPTKRAGLAWDPVRPLTGPGEWMERIRWIGAEPPDADIRSWFRPGGNGDWILKSACASDPARRLNLVRDLQRVKRDPPLHALLAAERNRLNQVILGAHTLKDLRASLRTLKQKLYPYQLQGVEQFLARGRFVLADDMGLGKTAQAIACAHALWQTGRVRRGLILVPAALKPQWLREWQIFTDAPAAIVDGGPEARKEAFRPSTKGFLIANYEQLLRDLERIHAWKPDMVVLDEAQRIKNWATKTAVYVKKLSPPYRLVLTGTPMENRLEELASIVEWVDDQALEPKWRLAPWHATLVDGTQEVGGARNLDTLRARLSGCMLRRIRKEVLDQLPSRTDTRVPVEMTPEQREKHNELNQPIAALAAIGRRRPLTQAEFLRLMSLLTTQRIISNGLAQLEFEARWPSIARMERPEETVLKSLCSPKLFELRELVERLVLEQERKVVVFSQWRRMLRLAHWSIRDLLDRDRLRAGFFTGEEGTKRRTQNIVEFHDDPAMRVLFASDAGGVGLNLQRAANCCINVELPWNPAVLEQRIGRIYRMGQKRPIDVYNLVSETGIEARITELVGNKAAFFHGLFDGSSNEVAFEKSGSFLSRIEKLVEPAKVPDLPANTDGVDLEAVEERELDRLVASADESKDAPAAPEPERPSPAAPEEVQRLFSSLSIRTTEKGGLVIEAPKEAAATLAALFEGMARLLQGAVVK